MFCFLKYIILFSKHLESWWGTMLGWLHSAEELDDGLVQIGKNSFT